MRLSSRIDPTLRYRDASAMLDWWCIIWKRVCPVAENAAERSVVTDTDAVYAQASDNGAESVIDIRDEGCGGLRFSCRDPEGQLWNVWFYKPCTDSA